MKTPRTAAIVLGAVALGGVGFIGCGGSDTSATTAAATAESGDAGQQLTAEEYISAADAVCSEITTQLEALTAPSDPAEIKAYVAEIATLAASGSEGLMTLVPPADLETAHKALVASAVDQTEFVNQVAAEIPDPATEADAAAAVEKLQSADAKAIDAEAKAAAAELGLAECGKDAAEGEADADSAE
ncbi:MAG: hypothetical protein FJW99_02365 [Actinobacteria bacterium]|nr:hypothetical protein [Actinomycetota bacterium]MBM3697965.1 hypothetical protein [Actinomycetota bacterium]